MHHVAVAGRTVLNSRSARVAGECDHETLTEYSRCGGGTGDFDVGKRNGSIETSDGLSRPREVVLDADDGTAADAGHRVEGRRRRNGEPVVERAPCCRRRPSRRPVDRAAGTDVRRSCRMEATVADDAARTVCREAQLGLRRN